ncbi:MAG: leucyl aminopeptidase family protein [Bdellovibrionales bacterium]|nr:leucyl aminopeptidase family protein [Bdellovibrionales bacterium]
MSKKTGKRSAKEKANTKEVVRDWQQSITRLKDSWVLKAKTERPPSAEGWARVLVLHQSEFKSLKGGLARELTPWDLQEVETSRSAVLRFKTAQGPLWLVRVPPPRSKAASHQGLLEPSLYTQARDLGGILVTLLQEPQIKGLHLDLIDWDEELVLGMLVGLELAHYKFQRVLAGEWPSTKLLAVTRQRGKVSTKLIAQAGHLGAGVNLARHLVNLPPNWLNPVGFADAMVELFRGHQSIDVDVWDEHRLRQEGMGLLLGVGQGAQWGPRLVHIRYRPEGAGKKAAPIAFVGKGITFDSGGLDLKPSSAMRLMKKDMGGAASVAGLAMWAALSELRKPCDFYLSLAENAVSGASMRPSDVLKGRNGKLVEINNTDAEGRLVLGDALDVAIQPPNGEKPKVVIDISTLTGAIKAGLGVELGGLFANHDETAEGILQAAQLRGDLCWRMPLYQPYHRAMTSAFADRMNSSEGYGGAVTAALFLETYVGDIPWAHLDIYAWQDRPDGALTEAGGNGQMVQCLAAWLS